MSQDSIQLPASETSGGMPLTQALLQRRSVRSFGRGALTLAQMGQLLWAAQGITSHDGLRSAPSAGALYPLEIHVAVGAVDGLDSGVYRYQPHLHRLLRTQNVDVRAALCAAALDQTCISDAAAVLTYSAVYARTSGKYGPRAERYVHMEAGHAAQNVFLMVTALGLHSVVVGAFDDDAVQQTLDLPADCIPLYLMPVGR